MKKLLDLCCGAGGCAVGYHRAACDKPCKFALATVRETWAWAMGIDWMKSTDELREAIPPAYTHYIGLHLLNSAP